MCFTALYRNRWGVMKTLSIERFFSEKQPKIIPIDVEDYNPVVPKNRMLETYMSVIELLFHLSSRLYALNSSELAWKTFFKKEPMITKGTLDLNKYRQFMKRGYSFNYWLEYLKTTTNPYFVPITLEGVQP